MNALGSALQSLKDIFNIGRLVFYLAAGALVGLPALMLLNMLSSESPAKATFLHEARADFVATALDHSALTLTVSLVLGFLIASVGYATILRSPLTQADAGAEGGVATGSLPYRYPWLAAKGDPSPFQFIVSEYFRFVEIGVYVPLGMLGGSILIAAYSWIHLFTAASSRGTVSYAPALSTSVALVSILIWTRWWRPTIVPTLVTIYERAKRSLIAGVEAHNAEKDQDKEGDDDD